MYHLDLYKYIDQPAGLKFADIEKLRKTTLTFPYFQAAHVLLLLAMKMQGHENFNNQLTLSSVHIPNRDLLYYLLNKDYKESPRHFEPEKKIENDDISDDQQIAKSSQNNSELTTEKPENNHKKPENKLLKTRSVRRKIKDSAEGMGENISETISSQIEFSVVKDDDKLEYSPEIYFMDDERTGKNNMITIDARPGKFSEFKNKDILQIDETEEIGGKDNNEDALKNIDKNTLDLSEMDKETQENKTKSGKKEIKNGEYFDINNYANEDEIIQNADENDLIARFIAEKPRIEPKEVPKKQEDISEDSTNEDDDLLTETLIKVYIAQGYLEKAIKSYEKLSLKYPEKSSYFASQIKLLKEKLNH